MVIRPEIRWDNTLNGVKAYDNFTKTSRWTFGIDIVAPFSIAP
jgi:hypothetical protein